MSTLTEQFLAWVASENRTYAEAMDAWRTSCPRLTIWEDAVRDGLVQIERAGGGSMREARVTLTAKGGALLECCETSGAPAAIATTTRRSSTADP